MACFVYLVGSFGTTPDLHHDKGHHSGAETADEVAQRYPGLKVLKQRPQWMSPAYEAGIRLVTLDDENDPFLARMRRKPT